MQRLAIIITGLLIISVVGFQTGEAVDFNQPLTLDDCINIAIENNILLSQSDLAVQTRQKESQRAFSGFLPDVSVSSSFSSSGGEQFFGNQRFDFEQKSSSLLLDASQNLFNGGYDYYNYKSARKMAEASTKNRDYSERALIFDVQQKYFDLLKKQRLLSVREEDVALSEKQLELAEALNEVGSAAKSDVLRAKATVSQKKLALLTSENDVNLSRADLSTTLGIDLNIDYEIVDVEGQVPTTSADVDLTNLTDQAMQDRLDMQATLATLESYHAAVKRSRSSYLPSLSLYGRYRWSNNDEITDQWSNMFDGVTDWQFGAQVSLNIFDGFAREANYNIARLNARSSQQDVEQKKLDIAYEVKQATLNYEFAIAKIQQAEESLAAAEEDLRLAEERYRLGVATIVDLNTAQLGYTDAKVSHVEAIFDYEIAKARLDYVTGQQMN